MYLNHILKGFASVALLGFILSSCGSSRRATSEGTAPIGSVIASNKSAVIEHTLAQSRGWQAFRATLSATIQLKQGKEVSSRMNMQAHRGEGIRISIVPFPLLELGRLHFTKDRVVLIDLMNKRYAEETYSSFSEYLGFTIDYAQIEAMLLGQVFVPGYGTSAEALERLEYSSALQGQATLLGKLKSYIYKFTLSSLGNLERLEVLSAKAQTIFSSEINERTPFEGSSLPKNSALRIYKGDVQTGALLLEWRSISPAEPTDLSITPSIKPSYQRITIDKVMAMLDKVA